jgi:hypothetical protein
MANGSVYVAYAQINDDKKQVVGAGLGFVDVYDLNGNLVDRAITQAQLNAPWGVAIAPAGFGSFGGDLLVGNFGDGVINAFDPKTFAFKGALQNAQGTPIANTGLWEIVFGSSTLGNPNTLYFAAGINEAKDGVFGSITVAQPTTGTANFNIQIAQSSLQVTSNQPATDTISLASVDGFSGAVSLSCSGLPANTSCSFNPASANLASSGTGSATVTIAESSNYSALHTGTSTGFGALLHSHPAVGLAFISPLALFAFVGFRRRSVWVRAMMSVALVAGLALVATGCSNSNNSQPTNPATVTVMVNATSGSITHSVPVMVTLQ